MQHIILHLNKQLRNKITGISQSGKCYKAFPSYHICQKNILMIPKIMHPVTSAVKIIALFKKRTSHWHLDIVVVVSCFGAALLFHNLDNLL